jgi:hypothetical protein
MNCKNCGKSLSEIDKFCSECGAQVVNQRLTLKYLFTEFYQVFFSIDSNRPLLTFIDLFKKPEVVIGGYINGTRKKYINAFGYFTIAVTISSLFYFIAFRFYPDLFDGTFDFSQNNDAQKEFGKKLQSSVFDYQNLLFFAAIPLLAFMSWIVFYRNKYNYAEHLIINLYTYSQGSIVAIILYILTIWNKQLFNFIAIGVLFVQILIYAYVLKRLYQLTFLQLIKKTLLFIVILIPLYLIVIVITLFILYLLGDLNGFIDAEKGNQAIGYIASSAINCTS